MRVCVFEVASPLLCIPPCACLCVCMCQTTIDNLQLLTPQQYDQRLKFYLENQFQYDAAQTVSVRAPFFYFCTLVMMAAERAARARQCGASSATALYPQPVLGILCCSLVSPASVGHPLLQPCIPSPGSQPRFPAQIPSPGSQPRQVPSPGSYYNYSTPTAL